MDDQERKIVRVSWRDAEASASWESLADVEEDTECPVVHSVGYLIASSEKSIRLAGTVGEPDCNAVMKIPTECVVEVEELSLAAPPAPVPVAPE